MSCLGRIKLYFEQRYGHLCQIIFAVLTTTSAASAAATTNATTANVSNSTVMITESLTTEADTTTKEQTLSTENVTSSQQTLTSDQTTSQLTTTVPQSTMTSPPPPDVHCCCRCCFPSTPTCIFCDGDSLTDASECANHPPTVPAPVDRETPKFEAPAPLKGSAFPERLALREDFIKKEQLTEVLAALPTSEKVDLGFKTTDMFIDCQYGKTKCSIK